MDFTGTGRVGVASPRIQGVEIDLPVTGTSAAEAREIAWNPLSRTDVPGCTRTIARSSANRSYGAQLLIIAIRGRGENLYLPVGVCVTHETNKMLRGRSYRALLGKFVSQIAQ